MVQPIKYKVGDKFYRIRNRRVDLAIITEFAASRYVFNLYYFESSSYANSLSWLCTTFEKNWTPISPLMEQLL